MSLYKPSEIFQFAIQIEENGEKFYRHIAQKLANPKIQELFIFLAGEELKHKKIYEQMVSKLGKNEPFETYPGEYFAYLRAYVDNKIFNQKKLDQVIANIKEETSAVNFAIDRELDSILYYQEMKTLVTENNRQSIDEIVEEERKHFLKLSDIKKLINNKKEK